MGRKWAKPDRLKTEPLAVTPLITACMAYGYLCQEYGKWSALAIKAKQQKDPKQKELWRLAFTAKDLMDAKLREIGAGWPTDVPPAGFVEPEKDESDVEDLEESRCEALHPGTVGSGPDPLGEVE